MYVCAGSRRSMGPCYLKYARNAHKSPRKIANPTEAKKRGREEERDRAEKRKAAG